MGKGGADGWYEVGCGQPGPGTLGPPSPSSPRAVVTPELAPIPHKVRKEKENGAVGNADREAPVAWPETAWVWQARGHFRSPHLGAVAGAWEAGVQGGGVGEGLTVTAQALAAQAQHQRGAAETLGGGWEAPGAQRV